jgi:uncharacterized OB-fold protein
MPTGENGRNCNEYGMGETVSYERCDHANMTVSSYKGLNLVVSSIDSEHRGYFEEAKQGRLVVQRCDSCDKLRGAIGASCPYCTSPKWSWQAVSGGGFIYSWQIVMQASHPAFREWVPYPIVLVQLDEQPSVPWRGNEDETVSLRIVANLCGLDPQFPEAEENVGIGKRVEVCFIDLGETTALPQFRLSKDQFGTSEQ